MRFNDTRSLLLATAAAVFLPSAAFAQEADDTLPEVVVTATRIPAIVADTPGARVIDSATVEQRGAVFAADILSDVPGLSVTRSGAFGGVAQVRMRGATPGKTLVLVDGAVVNDAAEPNGAYDFSGFDLGDIERIEVLSGPQSSLWGSDAIGGVIAFTTKEIDGVRAEAEAGSYDTLRGRLAGGVANDAWALGGYVSRFVTDGISVADEANGNPEADGFENTTVGVRGRYAVSSTVELDGSARWSQSEADLDNGFPVEDNDDRSESEQWSGVIRSSVEALGLDHQFSVSASDIERQTFSAFGSVFEADRQSYRWQANGETGAAVYAFGAEREESAGSISTGDSVSLGTTSVFATGRYQATDALSVTGGLRFDDTDDFGSETTGRLSAAWDVGAGFTLSGAWGTGFKAPTVSQAVCDFCFSSQPFPALRPETADGYEAAIGWRSADGRIEGRATVYRLNVDDQITYIFDPLTFDSYYVNIAETATDGVELEGRAVLGGGFDLTLAYAWTDARDESNGRRLARIPEHAASGTLGWTGDRLSAALTVRAEGEQNDTNAATPAVLDGFVTANLNAAYALTDNVTLTARVDNLADERYQQVLGYGEPGRSAFVGVRLRY
ncbi:TonB-dependent receptor plug domain-containing protein [Brevundimonas lenta]|uniref:Vitamin B12 transporter n=1 Tax=Brevundimonas lenta TaxID=424796 RepID=A0A7W6NNJ1_9CAUL|nr:TonB-dependent receptor [Brevundimonas lenta]MBB4081529.1 vitamin B12 transporter [Brevundimonas lenta]